MSTEYSGPTRGEHALLAADGFLFAGALWLAVQVSLEAVIEATGGAAGVEGLASWFYSVLWFGTNIVPIAVGAIAAWMLHARRITWIVIAGMAAGLLIGWIVGFGGFVGLATVIPGPAFIPIGILALLVVVLMIAPVTESAMDLAPSRRRHLAIDVVRLTAVAIIGILAVWIAPLMGQAYGSEMGEAGLFLIPVAFSGAIAVVGGDALTALVDRSRARRASGTTASTS